MKSILVKEQKKTYTKIFNEDGKEYQITATARYDDQCGNGHNSFSLTAEIWRSRNGQRIGRDCESCGCLHEDIAKHFGELVPFLKWHLVSSDEPMHYLANTIYHKQQGKIDYAKSSCVWGVAPDDSKHNIETMSEKALRDYLVIRLPHVQMEFKKSTEQLGFTF